MNSNSIKMTSTVTANPIPIEIAGMTIMKVPLTGAGAAENNDPATPTTTNAPTDTATTKKSNGKRKSASLPSESVEYLKAWMMSPEHISHPYPTEQEKVEIMKDTDIELKQLTNWFVNNRKRYWKPRVEAHLQQQAQAAQAAVQAHAAAVAAVSIACVPQQQQQQEVVAVTPEATRATLVSPNVVVFKSQQPLSQASNPLMTFDLERKEPDILVVSSPPSTLQQQLFASSPLTFAVQILEQQQRNSFVSVPSTSTAAVSASETSSSSAASVSASEGDMSDSGSDYASSDSGSTVLGTDLKFIDLKKKNKFLKSRTYSIASASSSSSSQSPQETTTSTRATYARNVSFCSLDKISCETETFSSVIQESQVTCSSISTSSKKRSLVADELPLVVATTAATTGGPPRKRFRTVSIDRLPSSLEEATRLFGFTLA